MSGNCIQYAELHCHSSFSLLDGASSPEELVETAKAKGLYALALTDHNDLGGAVRFFESARAVGMEAIVGAELTLEDLSHISVLVENTDGYKNLCRLLTKARCENSRGHPLVRYAWLDEHKNGLVFLSGCSRGLLADKIIRGDFEGAYAAASFFKELFGDSFYLELWDHCLSQEALISRGLFELATKLNIDWLVTNNVHYASPEKRVIHDVLTCLRHGTTLAQAGRKLRPNGEYYLKSAQEMARVWRHNLQGLKNTVVVADRCQFRLGSLCPSLPIFPLPEGFSSHNDLLVSLVREGAKVRYGDLSAKHQSQIDHELAVILRLDLAPYFLIMWDIVRFAKSRGIAVQGRGSAANSAVCYCLEITAVDPIGLDLLFERFLAEGRNEPPDIDLDIAHREREVVLQYVYEKYGREHAAMVCETITYRGRSAVRDAARVLGFPQSMIDKLAKLCHHREARCTAEFLENGGAQEAGLNPQDRSVQALIEVVRGLHQLPRHRSIHVGGFVLSGEAVGSMVPVEPASMPGRTIIQWDKDDLTPVGIIKIDLLGLGMLTMLQEATKLIKHYRGLELDLAKLDMDDQNVYEMLQRADTIGVFQIESRAQMNILPKLKPRCFYDIVVSIALVRPGPIQGNVVHPYVRRRQGLEKVSYVHPDLEPILKKTLGVPLFQEQGMRLAVAAAGFTPAQADNLRRVMSHKRSTEKMEKLGLELAEGMRKNGYTKEAIETIVHQLTAFANYGFPESHALSFGLLTYASAYLKKYFPAEFYAAILNAQPMGFYSPSSLIQDALRHKVKVLPPDVLESDWDCTLDESFAVRLGLRYIDGLGAAVRQAIKSAREDGGAFTSLEDFAQRTKLNQKALSVLAEAGALGGFGATRRKSLWQVLAGFDDDRPLQKLFKEIEVNDSARQLSLPIPEMTVVEEVIADYRTMGLSCTKHPMTFFRSWARARKIKSSADMQYVQDGNFVVVCGGIICRQRPGTAKGYVFVTLEDEFGLINVVVKPKVFAKLRTVIVETSFVVVSGYLQKSDGVVNLIATAFKAMPPLLSRSKAENTKRPAVVNLPSRDFQ